MRAFRGGFADSKLIFACSRHVVLYTLPGIDGEDFPGFGGVVPKQTEREGWYVSCWISSASLNRLAGNR